MFSDLSRFEYFLPVDPPESIDQLSGELRIYAEGTLEICYAPIGSKPNHSKLWILGITPGWNQMRMAYEEAAKALQAGSTEAQVAARRKP